MTTRNRKKKTKIEEALLQGLEDALSYERGKITLRTSYVQQIEPAPKLSKNQIKKLRTEVLHMSQPVFASILNVSPKTVEAWEQGLNQPSPIAYRLLHLLKKEPSTITKLLEA